MLPRSSIARNGPVPKLLRSGRWALPVWLLLVAAANERAMVDLRYYRNFATRCLGMSDGKASSIRSVVSRTIERLATLRLISVDERRHGSLIVQLRSLDGDGEPYTMPHRAHTKVVHIPTGAFFANAWHLSLSHVEVAALLISLTEETWQHSKFGPHQWEKSRKAIARDYGIAASTWSKGKGGLLRLGLLSWDMPQLAIGSRPERVPVDRYTVNIAPLGLRPEQAPRYIGVNIPRTVTSPTTGKRLRLNRQMRVQLTQRGSGPAKDSTVVNIANVAKKGRKRRPNL